MAKAIKFFSGTDTNGNEVQRAKNEQGVWFARVKEFNGRGYAFSRWEVKETDTPSEWGFNTLTEYDAKGYRLPNASSFGVYRHRKNNDGLYFLKETTHSLYGYTLEHEGELEFCLGKTSERDDLVFLGKNYEDKSVQDYLKG